MNIVLGFIVKYRVLIIIVVIVIVVLLLRKNWNTLFGKKNGLFVKPIENGTNGSAGSILNLTESQTKNLDVIAYLISKDLDSFVYTDIGNIKLILKMSDLELTYLIKTYKFNVGKSLYDDIAEESFYLDSDKKIISSVLSKIKGIK
jgi:hypothetical protein